MIISNLASQKFQTLNLCLSKTKDKQFTSEFLQLPKTNIFYNLELKGGKKENKTKVALPQQVINGFELMGIALVQNVECRKTSLSALPSV